MPFLAKMLFFLEIDNRLSICTTKLCQAILETKNTPHVCCFQRLPLKKEKKLTYQEEEQVPGCPQ